MKKKEPEEVECAICGAECEESDLCPGCDSYVCEDHDTRTGQHDLEYHEFDVEEPAGDDDVLDEDDELGIDDEWDDDEDEDDLDEGDE